MADRSLYLARLTKCLAQARELSKIKHAWQAAMQGYRDLQRTVAVCLELLEEKELSKLWELQTSASWMENDVLIRNHTDDIWHEYHVKLSGGIALLESFFEIQKAHPKMPEMLNQSPSVPTAQPVKDANNQVYNIHTFTGILGNVQNSQVFLYDYSSVNQLLIDHQIPKQDRRELEDIMDELKDAPPDKKPSIIKRGEDWIVKHKDALGAAAEVVGRTIGAGNP
jgi:hypothetical protein